MIFLPDLNLTAMLKKEGYDIIDYDFNYEANTFNPVVIILLPDNSEIFIPLGYIVFTKDNIVNTIIDELVQIPYIQRRKKIERITTKLKNNI